MIVACGAMILCFIEQGERKMVYIFALVGFVSGFAVGLGTINVILRHVEKERLTQDKAIKWKYGLLVWAFAFAGGGLGIWLFNNVF